MRPLAPPIAPGARRLRLPPLARQALAAASEIVRDRTALAAAIVLGLVVAMAIFAPLVAPHDPGAIDIRQRLHPPVWAGGTAEHLLGTDHLGRDVLSRIIFGSRSSILVGVTVVVFAGAVGTALGVIAGYVGGTVDDIIMRLVDIQTAFPGMLLVLLILTVIGPGLGSVITVLAVTGWMVYARLTRGQVLSLRELQFLEAAESVGCSPRRIMFSHVLPNLASPILTLGGLELARIILLEAVLSFLGVGIQPPQTSWGLMIAEGQIYITTAWWLVTLPGVAIGVTVLAVNLLAGWLRTNADPTQRFRQGTPIDA